MRKLFLCAILLAALSLAFLAGSWLTWRTAGRSAQPTERTVLYWVDPMHPSYKSDKPGIAPDCGMALEPVYADGPSPGPGRVMPANVMKVTPERQQMIGVQFALAEASPGNRIIRTVGRVTLDENRVYRVLSATDGIVRRLFPVSTGAFVAADQLLLDYYVREALGAQQSFFYALTTLERLKSGGGDLTQQSSLVHAQVRQAVEGLRGIGMDDLQIARLAKTRVPVSEIEVRAPVSGNVLARNVSPGQRFERGTELYRIADLTRVWIEADVFEGDAPLVHPGTQARFSAAYTGGRAVTTRVSQVLPQFDPASRTLKIRLETENPGFVLRPDMFVDVEMIIPLRRAVTVPVEAVVDSGSRKTVFVDRGNGYLEPRRVETGTRFENRIQVVKGLMEGERIVVSGNFLLDSESRLKMTALGISNPETDVVCGMDIDAGKARGGGKVSVYGGRTFYFCSDGCKKKFDADSRTYAGETQADAPAAEAAASQRTAPRAGGSAIGHRRDILEELGIARPDAPVPDASIFETDPVCGSEVDRTEKGALKSVYAGRTYYFLMNECKEAFDRDPAKYANHPPGSAADPRQAPQATRSQARRGTGARTSEREDATRSVPAVPASSSAIDPVCGMSADVTQAAAAGLKREHSGRTYYFCSEDCKKKFDKEPTKYATR